MAEPDIPGGHAERFEQFLIVVGDMFTGAALAGLELRVRTISDQQLVGPAARPAQPAPGEPTVNDTGYGPWLTVGTQSVRLADIVACEVRAPALAGE